MDLQDLLGNPEFNQLPIGDRLKVARNFPDFAGLPPKDQGTVLYHSAATFHPASDTEAQPAPDQGFWSTIGHDIMSIPGGIAHAAMNPGEALANATQARLALRPKAVQALNEGNLSGAAGYGLASVMPFVGPMAAQAGEELGGGQPGQGTAHAAELLAPFALRIPEIRDSIASPETRGTAVEFLKGGRTGKRWAEAKARYQASQTPPTPAPSVTPPPPPESPAATAPASPVTPSLDELTAGQTGGRWKKFSNAPADVQANIIKLHNRFAGQQPTPKPVPTTAAPPAVAPPPGMAAEPPAPSVIPRYASTELQPNSQFPPVEHMPSRYRAPNGEVSVSERIAHKKDVQIAEYLLSPESGVKIETPEDWNSLPLSEKNRIAGEAYIKFGGNPKFVQKGTTNFGANYRPGQQRSISGRSADVGIDHVYQTLKELMVPPPPQ